MITLLWKLIHKSTHRWWLERMIGESTQEQEFATPMPGLQDVPINELVVAKLDDEHWKFIKQDIIPLEPVESSDSDRNVATRQLNNMRAKLNSQDAFFVLVRDEGIAQYDDDWVLSIINPIELALPEDRIRRSMEVFYQIGELVGGSASRAALLATTGKTTI